MALNSTLLLAAMLLALATSLTPPVFPDQYEVAFNESAAIGPLSGNTTGKIYMDTKNNLELITRVNGHHDRYCGSVYKFANTPCNHYVVDSKESIT